MVASRGEEDAVSLSYRELDRRETPLGELVLRRRRLPGSETVVEEILLDGAFLMSSLVHESERALASLGLAAAEGEARDVLVGGLGLGFTAAEVLAAPRIASLTVVDLLGAVIDWHRTGLVAPGVRLGEDDRCRFVEADFFAWIAASTEPRYHAILVDIDHSPDALLHPAHAAFYGEEGLARLRERIHPDGAFALWSAEAPDGVFLARLDRVFPGARAEAIRFFNPLADTEEVNAVYVAKR
jgi:spermidine synthase